jgi:hypothetical protein
MPNARFEARERRDEGALAGSGYAEKGDDGVGRPGQEWK